MKSSNLLLPGLAAAALLIVGCNGSKEEKTSAAPPAAPAAPAAPAPDGEAPPPSPPPPGGDNSAPPPTAELPTTGPAVERLPELANLPDMEKLNWAVQAFQAPAEAPALTNLQQLVTAGYLRAVPAPPPGKKFEITAEGVKVVDGP